METNITIWMAFGAGVLSFISPCMLPLYPSYLSYITGVSLSDFKSSGRTILQKHALLHTLFFMVGFSVIFFALGLSATLVGYLFSGYQSLIRIVGGMIVFVMGMFMFGFFHNSWLMQDKRFELSSRPAGYLGSAVIGVVFAAGWTPCIGPILTSVLTLSATHPSQGVWMIISYVLGFSLPFFVMAFFIGKIRWLQRYASVLMKIGGVVMMLVGILLVTDQMTRITIWFIRIFGGFTGF